MISSWILILPSDGYRGHCALHANAREPRTWQFLLKYCMDISSRLLSCCCMEQWKHVSLMTWYVSACMHALSIVPPATAPALWSVPWLQCQNEQGRFLLKREQLTSGGVQCSRMDTVTFNSSNLAWPASTWLLRGQTILAALNVQTLCRGDMIRKNTKQVWLTTDDIMIKSDSESQTHYTEKTQESDTTTSY